MNLNAYIEHTLLKPDATSSQIETYCHQAIQYQFVGICVNSTWLPLCKSILPSTIQLVSVIGFPLGANLSEVKAYEAELAIKSGATEIDMVMNIGALKEGNSKKAFEDIRFVKKAIGKIPLKVIIETGLLTDNEKKLATQIVIDSQAEYIKTCTGFAQGSASVQDIQLMKSIIGNLPLKIKASGGIRTPELAKALIESGAVRLGTSQGVQLMTGNSSVTNTY
jgi:deoxyribose-phosphate aldolase